MSRNRVQKLILLPEYIEFKENLLAEAAFIELDKCGEPIRQVYLALSENTFMVASESVPNYFTNTSVKYNADIDLDTDGMDLEWVVPIGFIDIKEDNRIRVLTVDSRQGRIGHYMLSNIWGGARKDWVIWQEALAEVRNDPYSYTRCLFKNYEIPDKVYDNKTMSRKRSQILHKKALSLENLTNKVMNKMYQIQEDLDQRTGKNQNQDDNTSLHAHNHNNSGTLLCCMRDASSQTDVEETPKKGRKTSFKARCLGCCLGGKAKRRS